MKDYFCEIETKTGNGYIRATDRRWPDKPVFLACFGTSGNPAPIGKFHTWSECARTACAAGWALKDTNPSFFTKLKKAGAFD